MKKSNFNVVIGNRKLTGFWGAVVGILIAIPVLFIVGVVILLALSAAGVAITLALGAAGIAIVIGIGAAVIGVVVALIALLLPKKWRDKLGIHINFSHTHTPKKAKSKTTADGKPIVDVDYKDEK
ncbi:MAG: hypothetical protein ACRCWY_10180 [Cellulosilyticaceae bacterium]